MQATHSQNHEYASVSPQSTNFPIWMHAEKVSRQSHEYAWLSLWSTNFHSDIHTEHDHHTMETSQGPTLHNSAPFTSWFDKLSLCYCKGHGCFQICKRYDHGGRMTWLYEEIKSHESACLQSAPPLQFFILIEGARVNKLSLIFWSSGAGITIHYNTKAFIYSALTKLYHSA